MTIFRRGPPPSGASNAGGVGNNSFAVTERPRDASCLSVVSFSSTICRAQSLIISYFHSDLPLRRLQLNSVLFCSVRRGRPCWL